MTRQQAIRGGTRIATPLGEVPVEALRIGDAVLTAAGPARPIRWIGRRGPPGEDADPRLQPIRIAAAALDGTLPRRDLWVLPDHALLLSDQDGPASAHQATLVPAHLLVNGTSVTQQAETGPVTYFHIELDAHDAILAESQKVETFLDADGATLFDNAAERAALSARHGGAATGLSAPRIAEGPPLIRIRARIDALAGLSPGPFDSHVDHAGRMSVVGWIRDRDHPRTPVMVEILVDGAPVGCIPADRPRPDLSADAGNQCGFRFHLPTPLAPDRRHMLCVRRATDGAILSRGIALIDRGEALMPLLPTALRRHAPAASRERQADLAAFLATQIDALRRLRRA